MTRLVLLLLVLAATAGAFARGASAGPARLTNETVRAFLLRQERAWNREDAEAYFAVFTPDAVFVDQAETSKGEILRYGQSTLAQARVQSRRYFARASFAERNVVEAIQIGPGGASARVTTRKVTEVDSGGRRQTLCARTLQTLVMMGGTIRSRGQTDTATRCRDAAAPRP